MRVLGYCRGAGGSAALAAQRDRIGAAARERGWSVTWIDDTDGTGLTLRRPGIQTALDALAGGYADALVVADLERLSLSLLDIASLVQRAATEDWRLVVLDPSLDTDLPAAELLVAVLSRYAVFERAAIRERVKDAVSVRRRSGSDV